MLKVDNRRERFLSEEEEDKLVAYMEEHYASLLPVIVMAVNTGMRPSEILKLHWSDIDQDRGLIQARKTKNGKDRMIPMNSTVAELLAVQSAVSAGERVFDLKPNAVSQRFRSITKRLGLKNLRLHDLRHTFATRLGNANTDPFTLAEILGHSDLSQTKRYTHAFHQNKIKAVKALERKQRERSEVTTVATSENAVKNAVTKMSQFEARMPQGAHLN